jgi:pyridoxine 4-dehydrogenase
MDRSTVERDTTPAEEAVDAVAGAHGVSRQQVAVACLLEHSPMIVPIPGTSKVAHAHDDIDVAWLRLQPQEMAVLDQLADDHAH